MQVALETSRCRDNTVLASPDVDQPEKPHQHSSEVYYHAMNLIGVMFANEKQPASNGFPPTSILTLLTTGVIEAEN